MRTPARLAFALLSGTFIAGAAHAADMPEMPPPVIETPEAPAIAAVSGWYLRGDIGYKIYQHPTMTYSDANYSVPGNGEFFNKSVKDTGALGAGVGYRFNDYLRADVTGDYEFGTKFKGSLACICEEGGESRNSAKISATTIMGNVYADLGNYYGFSPYLGAGAGASYLHANHVRYDDPDGASGSGGSKGTWNFAWNLQAGVAYQLTQNLALDLNYRYLNLGDAKTGNVGDAPIKFKNIQAHEVRLGLRYDFF